MIGTTRRVNPVTNMIEWSRLPSNQQSHQEQKESIIYRLDPVREAGRLIFQIGTSDPDRAVAAARLVAGDVAGIDVNAGCPKPFSTSGGMGAALLRTPDKLCAILDALVREIPPAFDIGISVKIRLLETPAETEVLVRRLVATGITALTIHCRTTPMRKRERAIRAQLRMVAAVCHEAGVACLMNGDVEDRDASVGLVAEYGVDGAMIATAAEKNPSCFRARADGGLAPWDEVAERFLAYALEVENKMPNTKYLLAQLVPGKRLEYRDVAKCKTYVQLCEVLGHAHLMAAARAADERLELTPDKKKPKPPREANSSALAAGGQMAKARAAVASQARKSISERGVASATHEPQPQPAAQPVAQPVAA